MKLENNLVFENAGSGRTYTCLQARTFESVLPAVGDGFVRWL